MPSIASTVAHHPAGHADAGGRIGRTASGLEVRRTRSMSRTEMRVQEYGASMVVTEVACSHEHRYLSPTPRLSVVYCASLATHDSTNASTTLRSSQATSSPLPMHAMKSNLSFYVPKLTPKTLRPSEPLRGAGTRFLERYGGGGRKTSWNFCLGHPAEIAAYSRPSASAPTVENSSAPLVTARWVKQPPVHQRIPPPPYRLHGGGVCCCLIRVGAA